MERVGRLLVELAADEEFFARLIARILRRARDRWLVRRSRAVTQAGRAAES